MKRFTLVLLTTVLFVAAAYAAGIDGDWNVKVEIPDDTVEATWTFKTKGSALSFVTDEGATEVGTFKDGEFTYTVPKFYSDLAGYSADLTVKGKVDGDKISGTWEWDTYEGTFAGSRAK